MTEKCESCCPKLLSPHPCSAVGPETSLGSGSFPAKKPWLWPSIALNTTQADAFTQSHWNCRGASRRLGLKFLWIPGVIPPILWPPCSGWREGAPVCPSIPAPERWLGCTKGRGRCGAAARLFHAPAPCPPGFSEPQVSVPRMVPRRGPEPSIVSP